MPIMRTYQCPSCQGAFQELHMRADEGAPRFCKLCGFDTAAEETPLEPQLSAPHIAGPSAAATDGVLEAMRAGAEHRAQVSGDPSLRETDFKTNLRAGEAAYVPVVNPVTQFMGANPGVGGFSSAGAQHSGAVQTGPYPNAGAHAMASLRRLHGASGGMTTDLPALETMQPGYRRRA